MTIITKPSSMKRPLVQDAQDQQYDEHKVDIPVLKRGPVPIAMPEVYRRESWWSLQCISVTAFFVVISGFASGMILYHLYLSSTTPLHGYQGFQGYSCSIPLNLKKVMNKQRDMEASSQLIEPNYRIVPIQWNGDDNEDVQVFSTLDDPTSDDIVDALHEILDIRGTMEKIYVSYNGQRINFINDFGSNMSGIIDSDRCFYMELDPDLSLAPELLVISLKNGARLDTTPVRTTLQADLEDTEKNMAVVTQAIADGCAGKPIYHLLKDEGGPIIRKRSAEPAVEYVQFAGRHVQQIEIANFPQLIEYEKRQSNK